MEKKFKLTTKTIEFWGRTLYQIEALRDFGDVKRGDLGGWIESEDNLSQKDECWVYDNAKVTDESKVSKDGKLFGESWLVGKGKLPLIKNKKEIYKEIDGMDILSQYNKISNDDLIAGEIDFGNINNETSKLGCPKKNNRKVVWDFFGGLNGSIRQAIGTDDYEIYTFDIEPVTKEGIPNIKTDLANKSIEDLFKKLEQCPKPDFIVASPMCMSFSRGSAMSNGSTGFELNEDGTIRPRENFGVGSGNIITKKDGSQYLRTTPEKSKENGQLGIRALENTLAVIKKFKPNSWYVENPEKSLMWNYVQNNLGINEDYFNVVHYGAHGGVSKKPTIFYSNLDLELRKVGKGYRSKIGQAQQSRKDRSDIPKQLLIEVFEKFEKLWNS